MDCNKRIQRHLYCHSSRKSSSFAIKAKLSQERMANLIGVSRQTYYGVETGKNKMTWTVCIALIFYFNKMNATREMLNDLKIYPIELIMGLNDRA